MAYEAVAQGTDALVVVGGDGMVHLGLQAVGGTDVAFAVAPAGTAPATSKRSSAPPTYWSSRPSTPRRRGSPVSSSRPRTPSDC